MPEDNEQATSEEEAEAIEAAAIADAALDTYEFAPELLTMTLEELQELEKVIIADLEDVLGDIGKKILQFALGAVQGFLKLKGVA